MGSSSKARNSIRTAVSQQSGKSQSKRKKWLSRSAVAGTCIVLLFLLGTWWGGAFTEPQAVAELHSMV